MLTYSVMHEPEGMVQLFPAAKCPFLLQEIAETYTFLLMHR